MTYVPNSHQNTSDLIPKTCKRPKKLNNKKILLPKKFRESLKVQPEKKIQQIFKPSFLLRDIVHKCSLTAEKETKEEKRKYETKRKWKENEW